MSFNIPIQVDPGSSQSKIKGVGDSLADTEKKSERLARSIANLSRGFRSIGEAIATHMNRSISSAVRGFDSLSQALEREDRWMTTIRGNTRGLAQDMQTLDSMLKRNVISLREYQTAAAQARGAAGFGDPSSAVSLPGAAKKAATDSLGDRAFQSGAMAAGAAGAVGFGVSRIASFGDEAINLRNRLLQVTGPFQDVNDLFSQMNGLANRTRSDLNSTGEAFTRLMTVTRETGMTQERGIKIIETLNMALASSGANASEAAAGTLQLMQAIGSNNLAGDELRSVVENSNTIAQGIAKSMGISVSSLKQMGAEGKLTTKRILEGIESMASGAKKNFDAATETFGQFWTRQKNEAKTWIATSKNMHELYDERTGLLQQLRIADLDLINTMAQENEWIGRLASSHDQLSAAAYGSVKAALDHIDTGFKVSLMLQQQLEHMQNLHDRVLRLSRDQRTAFGSTQLLADFDSLAGAVDKAGDAYRRAASEAAEWRAEIERIAKLEPRLRNVGDGRGHKNMFFADSQTTFGDIAPQPSVDLSRFQHNQWKQLTNSSDEFADALERGALRQVEALGDALADFVMTGEIGFRKLADTAIRELTRIAAQQAVLGAIGFFAPGPLPSYFAKGSAGLDFKIPSFSAGGSVDTDSRMLAMRVSPNERVIVQTPGQQMASKESAASAPPRAPQVHITNSFDPRDLLRVINSPEGAQAIANVLRNFPGIKTR